MTRMKKTSRERQEKTPAREGEGAERYTGAFARVRLVRAWIAVAAAVVAMLYAYLALLERMVRWWGSFPTWRRSRFHARLATVLATMSFLGALAPVRVQAHPASLLMAPGLLHSSDDSTTKAAPSRTGSAARDSSSARVHAPTIGTLVHLGDYLDVSTCVADCFETVIGYTTPAYISRDVPRTATLLYRSGRAEPVGKLTLNVSDAAAPAGSSFRLRVKDQNGNYVTFSNGATSLYFAKDTNPATVPLGGSTRVAAQFDASGLPTGARLYTAYVTSVEPDGTPSDSSAVSLRIMTINDMASPYGAGVDIVGDQRIHTSQTGGVLVTDGSGSASFFSGNCSPSVTCSFTSPAADFSTLSTGSDQYRRTYPDGTVVTFNGLGQQISVADRFGNTTQYAHVWNAAYQTYVLSSITDPVGQAITFQYRDAASAGTAHPLGSLHKIVTQIARTTELGILVGLNNLQYVLELDDYYYARLGTDARRRVTDWRSKAGDVRWYRYPHAYSRAPSEIEEPPVVTATGATVAPITRLVEPSAAVLQAAAAGGGTSHATAIAAPSDLREAVTDPRGNTTYLIINRFGTASRVEAPLTNQANALFDSNTGLLTRTVSPTGAVVRYNWVGDQLRQVIDSSAGTTINIDYETQYSLPKRIYGSVADQHLTYDQTKTGWPLKESRVGSPSATPTTYVTDAVGRPTSITDPTNHVTSYGYEPTGFQNRGVVTTPNGQSTLYSLDGYGRTYKVTDPYNQTWLTILDRLNRVAGWASPLYNDTTWIQRDLLDNVTAVTDSKGQVYTTVRNALGWPVKQIDPAGRADSMAYDAVGNVTYVRTRAERQVRMEYDALNRVTKRIGVGGADTISYAYDVSGRWIRAETRRAGVLVSLDTIHTDSVGRTVKEQTVRAGGGSSWYVASLYGALDPGRTSVAVYWTGGGYSSLQGSALHIYDATKRLSMIQLASGHQTTFSYNADQLLDSIGHTPALGQRLYYTSSHALAQRLYNVAGVKTAFDRSYRTDSLARLVERAQGTAGQFQLFTYDLKGRLNYWTKKTQDTTPSCINLDGWGYDCSSTGATTTQVVSAIYDKVENPEDLGATLTPGNRLTAFNGISGMTFDADGNLTSKGTYTYDWDDFGQLKEVWQSGVLKASFAYDGFGRRIRKTSSAGTVQYVWDGEQLVLEADSAGTATQTYSYYPGVDRLHSVTAGGQTYYASIELATGDVNGLIRSSDNAVMTQHAYTPWGEFDTPDQTDINGVRVNSLRWKGLVYDTETGLYSMRARYYDPQMRRFISEDPIGLAGGINLYVFVGGDPVNGSDPSGLDSRGNGYTGCWELDQTITWTRTEYTVDAWKPVQCLGLAIYSLAVYQGSGAGFQGPSTGPSGQNTGSGNSGLTEAEKIARVDELERKLTGQWLNVIRGAVVSQALGARAAAAAGQATLERLSVKAQLAIINNPARAYLAGFATGYAKSSLEGSYGAPSPWLPSGAMKTGYEHGQWAGRFGRFGGL